jgi:hypothetical protein
VIPEYLTMLNGKCYQMFAGRLMRISKAAFLAQVDRGIPVRNRASDWN